MGADNYGIQKQQEEQKQHQRKEQKQQEEQKQQQRKEQKQSRGLGRGRGQGRGQQSPDDCQGAAGTTASGSGFNHSAYDNSQVRCPGNILSDISRLEVLIGGKRAGNNSVEITNEAADICRRLFQGGIMNIHTYRELIEELVELQSNSNHRDAYGYYSD